MVMTKKIVVNVSTLAEEIVQELTVWNLLRDEIKYEPTLAINVVETVLQQLETLKSDENALDLNGGEDYTSVDIERNI